MLLPTAKNTWVQKSPYWGEAWELPHPWRLPPHPAACPAFA
jgi:hypothetical protein